VLFIHTGQTGVERGATRAAMLLGHVTGGFCTPRLRDELGLIPPEIAATLTPSATEGARAALGRTLQSASALIMIVRDRKRVSDEAGFASLLRDARRLAIPSLVADPSTNASVLVDWVRTNIANEDVARLLVTGPRETRWPAGETIAWRLIFSLLTDRIPSNELEIPAHSGHRTDI